MARPTISRVQPRQYPLNKEYPPGIGVRDIVLWNGAKGLNFSSRLFDVPNEQASYAKNWRIDRGQWVHKPGTAKLGPGTSLVALAVFGFITSSGTQYIIRVTTTTIAIYNGGSNTWTDATGPALTSMSAATKITYSGWADNVMIQCSSGNLYQLNPTAGTYTQITTTGAAGTGAHTTASAITTFAGRAIVSQGDQYYRICWTTKNDNTNWTGVGSGFEDLFSTPGGAADNVLGVFPVTDNQALIVRSKTIWLMTTTGVVDVPFTFTRLYDKIACGSPAAVVSVPGGIIVPGLDDIYYITTNSIQALGGDIRPQYINNLFTSDASLGVYDELAGQFVLSVQEGLTPVNVMWHYDFSSQGWTRDEYAFTIKYLGYTRAALGSGTGTFDQLTGTFDALSGTFDNLGTGTVSPAVAAVLILGIAVGGAEAGYGFVIREDITKTTDWSADFQTAAANPTEIRSGLISTKEPNADISRVRINDIQLYYLLSGAGIAISIDWSSDGGTTWSAYSNGNTLPVTPVPDTFRFAGTIESPQIQIRLTTTGLAQLRFSNMHVFAVQGARSSQ